MKPRILLVEAQAQFREGLGGWLEGHGFEADLAQDGHEAVAKCARHGLQR